MEMYDVVVGGGDTAVSHVQRLVGIADRVTLVHRQAGLRSQFGLPGAVAEARNLGILLGTAAEEILGSARILAAGDVSSPLKMIITAVAQAAAAAHEAYLEIRAPYWAA